MKPNLQITGNMGMYYTCYKLSCMGWNVMPTARNARGIDIIAYNKSNTKFIVSRLKRYRNEILFLLATASRR